MTLFYCNRIVAHEMAISLYTQALVPPDRIPKGHMPRNVQDLQKNYMSHDTNEAGYSLGHTTHALTNPASAAEQISNLLDVKIRKAHT
jgi:hypothetical protein